MASPRGAQSGFSAVELLIALFVAAAFLATGYQLYGVIIASSGKARMQAIASSIAIDKARFHAGQATDPCTTRTASPTPTIPSGSGLGNTTISVTITCPYTGAHTTQVKVTITYGSPAEKVNHVIYTTPNL